MKPSEVLRPRQKFDVFARRDMELTVREIAGRYGPALSLVVVLVLLVVLMPSNSAPRLGTVTSRVQARR